MSRSPGFAGDTGHERRAQEMRGAAINDPVNLINAFHKARGSLRPV